jgi:LysR family glycine cleavage system transcriptional activator
LQAAVSKLPLLSDSSGSEGWRDWHEEAGYAYNPGPSDLVLSDSNVRVQAVIDGQGLALWDALIEPELISGALVYVSDVRLDAHGYYLVHPNGVPGTPVLKAFRSWIVQEAGASQTV